MKKIPHGWAWSILITALLLLENTAFTQKPHSGKQNSRERNKVSLHVKLYQDRFHPGSEVSAAVIVEIQKGWHINSPTPTDESYIPTSLQIKTLNGIRIVHIGYPKGVERSFDFAATPLNVYEGTICIWLKLSTASDMRPGLYIVPMALDYQACSDNVCLAPATASVDLRLQLVHASKKVSRINQDLFDVFKESDRQ